MLKGQVADELIVRSLQGRISDVEERRLAAWRAGGEARERHYQEVRSIWALGAALKPQQGPAFVPRARELERTAAPALPPRRHSRRRGLRYLLTGVAAAGIAAAAMLFLPPLKVPDAPTALGAAEFVTGPDEMVTVTLGDGSVVKLAPDSRLRVRATEGREVWLDGHAYFAVTRREGEPFRIRTHSGTAVVLGTRFDIRAREGRLRLLVVEGKVELAAGGRTVELNASELGEVVGDSPTSAKAVAPAEVRDQLRWMGDFIAFEGTPLGEAARELSAHYDVPIEVLDPELAKETVHGWFSGKELESVLAVVCRAVNAHCTILPSGVTIGP